jgi:hypothetical protein
VPAANQLVAHAELPDEVQLRFSAPHHRNLHAALAQSKHLCDEAFTNLYTRTAPADMARNLCARELTRAQLDWVLVERRETRAKPLRGLWSYNRLERTDVERLAALPVKSSFADEILKSTGSSLEDQSLFVRHASDRAALGWLEHHHEVVTDDVVVADRIAAALRRLWHDPDDVLVRRARAIAWMRPGVAALLAAKATTNAALALLVAPLYTAPQSRFEVVNAASRLETPHWTLERSRMATIALCDRPDLDEMSAERVHSFQEQLVGVRSFSDLHIGRKKSSAWSTLDRSDLPLSMVTDPTLLEQYTLDRHAVLTVSGDHDRATAGLRAYSWADLASNPNLSLEQAQGVHQALCHPWVIWALGKTVRRRAMIALKANHKSVVKRIPPLTTFARRARCYNPGWTDLTTPSDRTVAQWPVQGLSSNRAAHAAAYLTRRLGSNVEAWEIALGLADTFDGTVSGLVRVATQVSTT